jgi:CRISPR/Cas system-associated endonuclease/helicase Cas3
MRIELHEIPVKEVVEGYVNNDEEGVIGYNGRLNIRPAFQREFEKDETKNILVLQAPTGSGKTIIAAKLDPRFIQTWCSPLAVA